MKKILYLNHTAEIGGAERSLLLIFKSLDRTKFKPLLICPESGPLVHKARELGVEVHTLKINYFYLDKFINLSYLLTYLLTYPKLYHFFKDQKADLIHCNSLYTVEWAAFLNIVFKTPVIVHLRDLLITSPFVRQVLRFFKRRFKFIAISEAVKKELLSKELLYERTFVLPNAVDENKFNPSVDRTVFRKDLGIKNSVFLVGWVGRIDTWKGCFEFIESANILKKNLKIIWVMVGEPINSNDPYLLVKLKQRIKSLGLENEIKMVGFRENIAEVMAGLDVLVVPSYYEPFGRTVIEAMAVGTPVIGTNAGGIPEILDYGKTGILVPMKNSAAIAVATKKLYKSPSTRKKLAEKGIEKTKRCYTSKRQYGILEDFYNKLITTNKDDKPS